MSHGCHDCGSPNSCECKPGDLTRSEKDALLIGKRNAAIQNAIRLPEAPTARETTMRRFVLIRDQDVSGTSGVGQVAEGVEFSNGQVAIHWISQLESVAVYGNVKVLDQLHGHGGKTKIKWLDSE